ncbi:DUF2264 domain-containing protein [Algibacter luteus]|uniref:DUF2264 domain-containing protein n=1 Tax=Algibacter luteus TaxID=1178825 RepID=UPI00192B1125|nr:DUF2264 domain-containing protein [Algibacter luteus]
MKIKFLLFISCILSYTVEAQTVSEDRNFYIAAMLKISHPVLEALSKNELKRTMPVKVSLKAVNDRSQFTYLEAFGRTLAGIAPWLEIGPDETEEGQLREKYILLTLQSLKNATDPNAADYMNFSEGS